MAERWCYLDATHPFRQWQCSASARHQLPAVRARVSGERSPACRHGRRRSVPRSPAHHPLKAVTRAYKHCGEFWCDETTRNRRQHVARGVLHAARPSTSWEYWFLWWTFFHPKGGGKNGVSLVVGPSHPGPHHPLTVRVSGACAPRDEN